MIVMKGSSSRSMPARVHMRWIEPVQMTQAGSSTEPPWPSLPPSQVTRFTWWPSVSKDTLRALSCTGVSRRARSSAMRSQMTPTPPGG